MRCQTLAGRVTPAVNIRCGLHVPAAVNALSWNADALIAVSVSRRSSAHNAKGVLTNCQYSLLPPN